MPRKVSEKQSKRKRLILDAAGPLFWRKGYHETSVRDIAAACNIETSHLYYYYKTKEQILFEVIWEEIDRLMDQIKDLEHDKSSSAEERLRKLIRIHLQVTLGDRKSGYRMLPDVEIRNLTPAHRKQFVAARDHYDRIVRRIIADGADSGQFSRPNAKLDGFAMASMIIRARIWYSPRGKHSIDQIAERFFRLLTYGLKGDGNHAKGR